SDTPARLAAYILSDFGTRAALHSCLMQDEPERGYGFSRKMSLKWGRIGMLGIDHQHGRYRSGEPGADPGVFGGERGGSIRRGAASRGLRVGGADAGAARVCEFGPRRQ